MAKVENYVDIGFPKEIDMEERKEEVSTTEKGLKYDKGKPRMDLIPGSCYKSLANVLTFGAKTYKPNSWQGVEPNRYVAALLRHLVEYMEDPQAVDPESGLLHIEHALCNAMFLNHFESGKK